MPAGVKSPHWKKEHCPLGHLKYRRYLFFTDLERARMRELIAITTHAGGIKAVKDLTEAASKLSSTGVMLSAWVGVSTNCIVCMTSHFFTRHPATKELRVQPRTKQYGLVFDKRVVPTPTGMKETLNNETLLKTKHTWFFILFLSLKHTHIVYTLSLCLAFIICFTINSVGVLRPGRASIALTIFLSAAHLSLRFLERL